jgi:membrane-bound lytic murein transglycosylase MltF
MTMFARQLCSFALCAAMYAATAVAQTPQPAKPPAAPRALPTDTKPWKGDFDGMIKRRHVRVLVPYSRTLYYNDRGRERGITADLVRDFEQYINKKYAKELGKRPITVYMIPTTRDELLPDIAEGLGDIAAGNITVTDARRQIVDFVAPADQKPVSEVVVTGPKSPAIAAVEDLSGAMVHVRKTSSYHESLVALNERLRTAGKAPARLVLVPDALEDEDMMDMLNAGLLEAIVVDDWKARIWAQVLPKIKVNEGAVVRSGARVGWAVRKDSPEMQAILNEFWVNYVKKHGLQTARQNQYANRIKQLKDPTGSADWKRFEETVALFRKYGEKYGFDPLMLAAQGYQESGLDQNAKSHVGAIGVMQIMPATGTELKVGDIKVAEPNIHGGAKYMDQLMTRYFPDAKFSEANRSLFAFASYNAGPGRISQMRKEAAKRGLDPDRWFNNVELVTAEKVGIETTTYVRNIYKYYAAYKLMLEARAEQQKARESLAPGKP